MEIIYYSYKRIVPDAPGIEVKDFVMPELEEGQTSVYLGTHDSRHYISLPKAVDIGPQDPACDVQKHVELPPDAEHALLSGGELVTSLNLKQSLDELVDPANISTAVAYEIAHVRTELRAMAEVIAAVVAGMPATMSLDDRAAGSSGVSPGALAILNKLTGNAQSIKDLLGKAGL